MAVFYTTLGTTFFLAICSRLSKNKGFEWFMIFLIALIFILVAGLRLNIGDTGAYVQSYEQLGNFTGFFQNTKDKGFTYFQLFLYKINKDPQFLIFITSLITQGSIIYTLGRYRSYFELEVYMYITCGAFLVSMNGIRQAMVGALLFLCTDLISKNKFIPYCIIVLILSTMHSSALIMIPIYFIVRKEAWSKTTFMVIGIAMICFLFFNKLMPGFFDLLQNSSYSEYEDVISQKGGGASFMRVLVNTVPVVLAYIKRDKLKELWPDSNIFINMVIINLIFITFALYNWIFARFQIYFQLYNIVLIAYIIKNCFDDKNGRNLLYYCFIVCYFIFFYYEQVINRNGLGYLSKYIHF